MATKIKLKVVDWWNDDNKKNFDANPFVKLLRQKYKIIYSNKPDFLFCGPFGHKHFNYDCVKIFYTGENIRIDWNLYDYGMGFDYMDFCEHYLHLPLFYLYNHNFERRDLGERSKFCAYIVRHSGANQWGKEGGLRDRFFDKLSKYKKVDSGGGWRNNIGRSVENKGEWLKDYKFNLCFENSSYAGYLTEKLFDAYNAGCIPIYWGDTSLRVGVESIQSTHGGGGNHTYNPHDLDSIDMRIPQISPHLLEYKINPKAFINAHNFPNLDSLVEEVKRIDNDDKAYNAMRNEPLFLDNFNPKAFYEKKVLEFFDNIFSQSPNLAFRRGEGQHLNIYRKRIANISKYGDKMGLIDKFSDCEDLGKDALNLAKFYDNMRKSTRKFRHKLKFWKR